MKVRKKPVVVEAEEWFPGKEVAGVSYDPSAPALHMEDRWYCATLNGPVRIVPGEWIITGVNGEHYPCKPDIFEKTYEPVADPT